MKPSQITKILSLILLFGLTLSACNVTPTADSDMTGGMDSDMADMDTMLTGDALRVEAIRSRPAPLAGGTGAAYMTIINPTELADQLVSVSSPAAAVAELHETMNDDGVMRMVPQPDGFEIPARSVVMLAPGGKHVMLINLVTPLEVGQEFELTLTFEQAGEMAFIVPVMEMTGMPAMDMGN